MRRVVAALAVAAWVSACGGGNGGHGAAPISSGPALLAGSDSATAVTVVAHEDGPATASPDIVGDVLLDRILVAISPTATVGQVNAAGQAVGALSIVSSEAGSPLIVLEVPRQADIAALGELVARMRVQPGIVAAWPGRAATEAILPSLDGVSAVAPSDLAQLLGERFPEAWNARFAAPADCLQRIVDVYVWDFFGSTVPRDFFLQIDQGSFFVDPNFGASGSDDHGYEVTEVLAAKFDADTPTGADPFPDCVAIHEVQTAGLDHTHAVRHLMDVIDSATTPRIIVNASQIFARELCGANGNLVCDASTLPSTTAQTLKDEIVKRVAIAGEWAARARANGFADKVLLVQGAGNIDAAQDPNNPPNLLQKTYAGFRDAAFASPPALATHLDSLQSLLADAARWQPSGPSAAGLPDLTFDANEYNALIQQHPEATPGTGIGAANLIVVGSVGPTTTGETAADLRVSDFSFAGADVGAVGEGVVLPTGSVRGTSFSTPEVAGLAAYLWNLSPALETQGVAATADLIKRSAEPIAASPFPVADAYAATLLLDEVPGCCSGNISNPIRLALVDVDRSGVFDATDLQQFYDAYHLGEPNAPSTPTERDFGEFDLNGDGYTGGIPIAAFDLDANGLDVSGRPRINTVDETVEGFDITFNEAALSDIQVLCFYAYSPLYASDQGGPNDQMRTQLLGSEHCVGAQLAVLFPAQIGTDASLTATVTIPSGGNLVPAPNLLVEMAGHCATVNPTSGRTDANGQLTTTVSRTPGCGTVSVDVTARADPDTTVLAHQTVTAQPTGAIYVGSVSDRMDETNFTTCNANNICTTENAFIHDDYQNLRFELQSDGTFTATGTYTTSEGSDQTTTDGCHFVRTVTGSGVVTGFSGRMPDPGNFGFIDVNATIHDVFTSNGCRGNQPSTTSSDSTPTVTLGSDGEHSVFIGGDLTEIVWDFDLTDPTSNQVFSRHGQVQLVP